MLYSAARQIRPVQTMAAFAVHKLRPSCATDFFFSLSRVFSLSLSKHAIPALIVCGSDADTLESTQPTKSKPRRAPTPALSHFYAAFQAPNPLRFPQPRDADEQRRSTSKSTRLKNARPAARSAAAKPSRHHDSRVRRTRPAHALKCPRYDLLTPISLPAPSARHRTRDADAVWVSSKVAGRQLATMRENFRNSEGAPRFGLFGPISRGVLFAPNLTRTLLINPRKQDSDWNLPVNFLNRHASGGRRD